MFYFFVRFLCYDSCADAMIVASYRKWTCKQRQLWASGGGHNVDIAACFTNNLLQQVKWESIFLWLWWSIKTWPCFKVSAKQRTSAKAVHTIWPNWFSLSNRRSLARLLISRPVPPVKASQGGFSFRSQRRKSFQGTWFTVHFHRWPKQTTVSFVFLMPLKTPAYECTYS